MSETFGVSLIYFFSFFESGGGGVCSNARSASSNLTPLKLGSISFAGRFLCFARFDSDTDSLSAPRNMRGFWFYQAIKLLVQPIPSNRLPIGQPLASDHSNRRFHALAVCLAACVPTKRKFVRVFRQVFATHMVPRAINTSL